MCMYCNFDIQTTKQMSVQFDFHFFFGFVLLSVRRSMACCLQSRAKKEIQSCIVFWRAQCASKACSDYKAQGRRIRNYRRWETTETWWLLSGECMDFSTYISVLCKKFCMKYLVRQQRFQTLSAQWEMGRNLTAYNCSIFCHAWLNYISMLHTIIFLNSVRANGLN